jgi:hypothetical protein
MKARQSPTHGLVRQALDNRAVLGLPKTPMSLSAARRENVMPPVPQKAALVSIHRVRLASIAQLNQPSLN